MSVDLPKLRKIVSEGFSLIYVYNVQCESEERKQG